MKNIKVGKNVTLTLDNVLVIEQMMAKTKTNFSKTLNYVLSDWVKIRQMLAKEKKMTGQDAINISKRIADIKKAKVVKE